MSKKDKIRLNSFAVDYQRWGENQGLYEAKASFSSKDMNFTISLPTDLGEKLLEVCKEEIGRASERALEKLTMMTREESKEAKQ